MPQATASAVVHPRNLQKLQSKTESSHTVRVHDVVHHKYIWCGENKERNSSTHNLIKEHLDKVYVHIVKYTLMFNLF